MSKQFCARLNILLSNMLKEVIQKSEIPAVHIKNAWIIYKRSQIQNTPFSRISSIFINLPKICNRVFYGINANLFLHYFQI